MVNPGPAVIGFGEPEGGSSLSAAPHSGLSTVIQAAELQNPAGLRVLARKRDIVDGFHQSRVAQIGGRRRPATPITSVTRKITRNTKNSI